MTIRIRPVSDSDWPSVAAIFNHYIEHSMAAYLETPVHPQTLATRHMPPYPFFVAESENGLVGFGFLSPYHPAPTLHRTGVLTYFLNPEATGQGLGSRLLERLLEEGSRLGIDTFLAHISSHNTGSLRFHLRHGFTECGRFRKVGRKFGQDFDLVWVERHVQDQVQF